MAQVKRDLGTVLLALLAVSLAGIPLAGLTVGQALASWILLAIYGAVALRYLVPLLPVESEMWMAIWSVFVAFIAFGSTGFVFGIVPGGVFASLQLLVSVQSAIVLVVLSWVAVWAANWILANVKFAQQFVAPA